jgi:hypothetical protein
LVKDFVAKKNVTTLEIPAYSPGLDPSDFFLFFILKSAVNGWPFLDVTDIIMNATEELKIFSQNAPNSLIEAGRNI